MRIQLNDLVAVETWCAKMHLTIVGQIKDSKNRNLIASKINFLAILKPSITLPELEFSLRELSFDIWNCLKFVCSLIQVHDYVCIWHDELIEIFSYANNTR